MERKDTAAYKVSKVFFNQIYAKHPEEKNLVQELFTHLWSNFWTDSEYIPGSILLHRYDHIRRQDSIMTRVADLRLFTHAKGKLNIGESGKAFLIWGYKEMNLDKLESKIESIEHRYLKHHAELNDRIKDVEEALELRLKKLREEIIQLKRANITLT